MAVSRVYEAGHRDYRVVLDGAPGAVELDAAWKRASEAGREFLSIILDDPVLPHPVNAALMAAEDGAGAILIWSRLAKRQAEAGSRLTAAHGMRAPTRIPSTNSNSIYSRVRVKPCGRPAGYADGYAALRRID